MFRFLSVVPKPFESLTGCKSVENENIGKDTRRYMSLGLVRATYIHAYKHTNLFDNTGRIKRQLKS